MRSQTFSTFLFALCVVAVALVKAAPLDDCFNAWEEGKDYFPDKVTTGDESGFKITYHGYYKVVHNFRDNSTYVIHCTAALPNVTFPDVNAYFRAPVASIAALDTASLGIIDALGLASKVKYVSDQSIPTSPCVQSYAPKTWVGGEHAGLVDIVFSNASLPFIQDGANKTVTVSLGDSLIPVEKAEWIKYVSVFFNLERQANDQYASVTSNYKCNALNMDSIVEKKVIAWVQHDFATREYIVKANRYYQALTWDAGATLPTISENRFLDLGQFQAAISDAYLVIDQTGYVAPGNIYDDWQRLFGYFKTDEQDQNALPYFIKNKLVWRTDKLKNSLGYDDWSESATARPDLALRDLISVQYPTYDRAYQPTWFENFSKSDETRVLTADSCQNDSSDKNPINAAISQCSARNFTGQASGNGGNGGNSAYSGGNTGTIVAYGVGGGVFLILSIVGITWFLRRRSLRKSEFVEMKDDLVLQMTESGGEIKVITQK